MSLSANKVDDYVTFLYAKDITIKLRQQGSL